VSSANMVLVSDVFSTIQIYSFDDMVLDSRFQV